MPEPSERVLGEFPGAFGGKNLLPFRGRQRLPPHPDFGKRHQFTLDPDIDLATRILMADIEFRSVVYEPMKPFAFGCIGEVDTHNKPFGHVRRPRNRPAQVPQQKSIIDITDFEVGFDPLLAPVAECIDDWLQRAACRGQFDFGDLEVLPYDDGSFDVVTGFNSFQYAANPARAMKEAARVARVGATIVIATWGDPDGMDAAQVVSALKSVLPPPAPDAPGPFALSAPDRLTAFAASGGLEMTEILDIEGAWIYPDLDTALRGLASSGVAARAIRHAGATAFDEAHAKAVAPFRQFDGSHHVGATFKVCFTRPARSLEV